MMHGRSLDVQTSVNEPTKVGDHRSRWSGFCYAHENPANLFVCWHLLCQRSGEARGACSAVTDTVERENFVTGLAFEIERLMDSGVEKSRHGLGLMSGSMLSETTGDGVG